MGKKRYHIGGRRAKSKRVTVAKQVKNTLNSLVEKKYLDTDISFGGVTTAGHLVNLGAIPTTGDAVSARIGEKVRAKHIKARFSIAAQDSTNVLRIVWFRALNSQGAVPTVSNLLGNWYDHLNNVNVPARFKILSDRTYALNLSTANDVRVINQTVKIDKTLTFSGTSVLPYGNALYFMAISDSSLSGPPISGKVRLFYTDM